MTRFVVDAFVSHDTNGRMIDTINFRHYGATRFVNTLPLVRAIEGLPGYGRKDVDYGVIAPQAWAWRRHWALEPWEYF